MYFILQSYYNIITEEFIVNVPMSYLCIYIYNLENHSLFIYQVQLQKPDAFHITQVTIYINILNKVLFGIDRKIIFAVITT